tara:strand:+ start:726 stop:1631 length:906 start_codon:yes stop_codon:yes gene_type:complete
LNVHFENVNFSSSSGPNSFANKLKKYFKFKGITCDFNSEADAYLCFIESRKSKYDGLMFQRLDGIYFNTAFNYSKQNSNIKRTYHLADGVIFQSEFNKKLIFKYFGPHENYEVIHNGADLSLIEKTPSARINNHGKVWACASSWRPHKRLKDNISYFLSHSSDEDSLIIAGDVPAQDKIQNKKIRYLGNLSQQQLLALYKRADYFIHLAWLDHCPNVVVDAVACGCQIICSSAGGTKEIAGSGAIIIQEDPWDFSPVDLYNPPDMDFSKKTINAIETTYDMMEVAKKYENFFISTKRKLDS